MKITKLHLLNNDIKIDFNAFNTLCNRYNINAKKNCNLIYNFYYLHNQ